MGKGNEAVVTTLGASYKPVCRGVNGEKSRFALTNRLISQPRMRNRECVAIPVAGVVYLELELGQAGDGVEQWPRRCGSATRLNTAWGPEVDRLRAGS